MLSRWWENKNLTGCVAERSNWIDNDNATTVKNINP